MKTCSECRYWAKNKTGNLVAGQCRAEPPKVFLLGMTELGQPISMTLVPESSRDFWCGHWTSKLNLLGKVNAE